MKHTPSQNIYEKIDCLAYNNNNIRHSVWGKVPAVYINPNYR